MKSFKTVAYIFSILLLGLIIVFNFETEKISDHTIVPDVICQEQEINLSSKIELNEAEPCDDLPVILGNENLTKIQKSEKSKNIPPVSLLNESEFKNILSHNADIKIGNIGSVENTHDNPGDNVFLVKLNEKPNERTQYVLEYEVKGIVGVHSVSRSINEFKASGGYLVNESDNWSPQKERINPQLLNAGVNSIRFISIDNIPYQVRNVRLTIDPAYINNDVHFSTSILDQAKDLIYFKGFVTNKVNSIFLDNQFIDLTNNEFEYLGRLSEIYEKELIGVGKSGQVIFKKKLDLIPIGYSTKSSLKSEKQDYAVGRDLSNNIVRLLNNDFEIEASAILKSELKKIKIELVSKYEQAPLNAGLKNVTKGKKVFRCLPHRTSFQEPITLKIPYDPNLIPNGYSHKDIGSYYFNEFKKAWLPVEVDSVDEVNHIVYAKTDHFSDYINGIIEVPETPGSNAFTPTVMQDIKAADPFTGLNIMSPPQANQFGDARTSFAIQAPAARNGMTPNLSLNYSSDGGSSWVGYGWSLHVPSLRVDERWGAPLFDTINETEIYSLNGEQLIHNNQQLPNRHEVVIENNEENYVVSPKPRTSGTTRFYERRLGSFAKIERIGTSPKDYYWKVTTTDGVVHIYGDESPGTASTYVLKSEKGISKWLLQSSTDRYGNTIKYEYSNLSSNETSATNLEGGTNLYLSSVLYNGFTSGGVASDFKYRIDLIPVVQPIGIRHDINLNTKNGFFQVDSRLLDRVEVYSLVSGTDELIRAYELDYQSTGVQFRKTLLKELKEFNSANNLLHSHTFDYYNDLEEAECFFSGTTTFEFNCDEDPDPCNGDTNDSDGDGVPDSCDNCPDIYNPLQNTDCVPIDDCGETDIDGDSENDLCDNCPNVSNSDQSDTDSDGVGDVCDNCPIELNSNQLDQDDDGVGNVCDNCPSDSNPGQLDDDNDGIGNACDNCPNHSNSDQNDIDGDGVGDACDNCVLYPNADQYDNDGDNVGILCDNCPYDNNPGQEDSDGDGIGDICDPCPNDPATECDQCDCEIGEIQILGTDCARLAFNEINCPNFDIQWEFFINGEWVEIVGATAQIISTHTNGFYRAKFFSQNCEVEFSNPFEVDCHVGACSQNDSTDPTVICDDFTASIEADGNVSIDADDVTSQIADNCHVLNVTLSAEVFGCSDLGANVVEVQVMDYFGNTSTCFATVTVTDPNNYCVQPIMNQNDGIEEMREAKAIKIASLDNAAAINELLSKETADFPTEARNSNNGSRGLIDPVDPCPTLTADFLIPISNEPGYSTHGSFLGTSLTVGGSTSGSLGIGLGCLPNALGENVTLQGGVNYNGSQGRSHISSIDLDGNGLEDLVYKQGSSIYFRPHRVSYTYLPNGDKDVNHQFGDPIEVANLDELYATESSTWGVNVSITASAGPVGGNVGISESDTESKTLVYIADVNADGFPDIAYDGVVSFNSLQNGIPTFSTSSEPTENMIVTGKILTDEELIPSDGEFGSYEFPSYDVIKVWEAPSDGNILISNLVEGFPTDAKVSIETDNNGFYGYPTADQDGTCRIFHGQLSELQSSISSLPGGSNSGQFPGFNCSGLFLDPCTLDSDGDGVNDCIDECPGTDDALGCTNCEDHLILTNPILNNEEMQSANYTIEATNDVWQNADALYHTSDFIDLKADFHVDASSEFLAKILGCTTFNGESDVDDSTQPDNSSSLRVKKGQKLYFRIHDVENDDNPVVQWNPKVEYTSVLGKLVEGNEVDNDGKKPFESSYSDGFILSKSSDFVVPAPSNTTVSIDWGAFVVGNLKNDVELRISSVDNVINDQGEVSTTSTIIFQETLLAGTASQTVVPTANLQSVPITYSQNSNSYTYTSLRFEALSATNVDWKSINWHPAVSYSFTSDDLDVTMEETEYPIVDFSIYATYKKEFDRSIPYSNPHYNNFEIYPISPYTTYYLHMNLSDDFLDDYESDIENNEELDGIITLAIESNGQVLDTRTITRNGGSFQYDNPGPIVLDLAELHNNHLEINLYGNNSYFANHVLNKIESETHASQGSPRIGYLSIFPNSEPDGEHVRFINRKDINIFIRKQSMLGHFYRDWAQFFYSPTVDDEKTAENSDGFGTLIKTNKLYNNSDLEALGNAIDDLEIEPGDLENITTTEGVDTEINGIANTLIPNMVITYPIPLKQVVQDDPSGFTFIEKWHGLAEGNYSSEFGGRTTNLQEAIFDNISEFDPISELTFDVETGAQSPVKVTRTLTTGYNYGAGASAPTLGSINFGANKSNSKINNLSDFFDLNGDRYPDHFHHDKIYFTSATGGLEEDDPTGHGTSYTGITSATSEGFSASGEYTDRTVPADNPTSKGSIKNPKFISSGKGASMGLNGNISNGNSLSHVVWLDFNGDGLSDRVSIDDTAPFTSSVELNNGDGTFTTQIDVNMAWFLQNASRGFGYGGGFSLFYGGSFQYGFSASSGYSSLRSSFIDINSDGLVDRVFVNGNDELDYQINTGTNFITDVNSDLFGCITMDDESKSTSNNENVAATGGFAVPLFFFCVKFTLNFNKDIKSKTINKTLRSLKDFDGDGHLDFVEQLDDGSLSIRYSNIKRTNKLKSITTPIGGEFVVDYEVVPPTNDNPNGKWAMSKVKVIDKHKESITNLEWASTFTKYYKYHNGRYDRRERDFLGFGVVRTIESDESDDIISANPSILEQNIYRQNINVFDNSSYYRKGKLTDSYMYGSEVFYTVDVDGTYNFDYTAGQLYSHTQNVYELRDILIDEDELWLMSANQLVDDYDVGGTKGLGRAFCILNSTTSTRKENPNSNTVSLTQSFDYDDHGRIESLDHNGDHTVEIDYFTKTELGSLYTSKNIITIPKLIEVLVGTDVVRTRAVTTINSDTGNPEVIEVDLNGNETKLTQLDYDGFGNVREVISPQDEQLNSTTTTYIYDDEMNQFLKEVQVEYAGESYISSNAGFDYKFGTSDVTTDVSGNMIHYTYDDMGRPLTIQGPKENAAGVPYTIKFEYHPYEMGSLGGFPYAKTYHYDPQHPTNDMITYTIGSGTGEAVQVKKDITLYPNGVDNAPVEYMTISGIALNDKFGRVTKSYHPNYELQGSNNEKFNSSTTTYFSRQIFDELDRPLVSIEPNTSIHTTFAYKIEDGLFKTTASAPQNGSGGLIETEEYKDENNLLIKTINKNTPNGDVLTSFEYDGIFQLEKITNPLGQEISYEYDMAGRVTKRTHPDAGIETYDYDLLDNVISKKTPNIVGQNANEEIDYSYDALGRILSIEYPDYATGGQNINNTLYTYYDDNAADPNNRGKLKWVEDATGIKEFRYGNMGEVVQEIRTVIAPDMPTRTFNTSFGYDTWNRIEEITYPDDEVVSYAYDQGGSLTEISSSITSTNYIEKVAYDHYGSKTYCEYGNQSKTFYIYEADMRRLDHLISKDVLGNTLFDNDYSYDYIGNITSINNIATNNTGEIGGAYSFSYSYDNLNRLVTSPNGTWTGNNGQTSDYDLTMTYDALGRIDTKTQEHNIDNLPISSNTYLIGRKYNYLTGSNKLESIDHGTAYSIDFTYDANGNMLSQTHSLGDFDKRMAWDETNRMKGVRVVNQLDFQHYVYDAGGERVLKAKGDIEEVSINGNPPTIESKLKNYTTYPSGYITVSPTGRYTKHYYDGANRIVSRLSGNEHSNFSDPALVGNQSGTLPTRQLFDIQNLQDQLDMEPITFDNTTPAVDDCTQYTPGSAAYNQCKCEMGSCPSGVDVMYYFHRDHLGSASYLTDASGYAYQFVLYLPWGESMVEQNAASFTTPYLFNGKELDSETGLYNYGARYYDPSLSLFTSPDPVNDLMPGWSSYHYAYNNPVRFIDVNGLYGDESEALKQRQRAIDGGLKVGDVYLSGDEWGFNVINGEDSYSVFEKDFPWSLSGSYAQGSIGHNDERNNLISAGASGRLFGGTVYDYTSNSAISKGAEATAVSANVDLRIGHPALSIHGEAEGHLLKAESSFDLGWFTGQKNINGLYIEGNMGVFAADGELRGGGSILGVKWTYEVGGCVGCFDAGLRAGLYFNDSTRMLTFDLHEELGFIIGEKAGLKIEIPIPKIKLAIE